MASSQNLPQGVTYHNVESKEDYKSGWPIYNIHYSVHGQLDEDGEESIYTICLYEHEAFETDSEFLSYLEDKTQPKSQSPMHSEMIRWFEENQWNPQEREETATA